MAFAHTAAGARIAWDAFGEEAAPPLLLIQGLGAARNGWRPGFCRRLAQEGFRVIRFDNRDVGQSEHYPKGGYAWADFAHDTAALLDALGVESAHIVGQSMGGIIAQHFWRHHPTRVRSLGLMYMPVSLRHARGMGEIQARMARPIPKTREEFVDYYLDGESLCASPGYPQDVAWLRELGGEIWDQGWDPEGAGRQSLAVLAAPDQTALARSIRTPTVLIAGDGDRLIDPASAVEMHGLIADSTLRIFEGMGHELPEPLWGEIAGLLAANARRAS